MLCRRASVLRLSRLCCIARRTASVVVALRCSICPIVPPSILWKSMHHQMPGLNTLQVNLLQVASCNDLAITLLQERFGIAWSHHAPPDDPKVMRFEGET